MKKIATFFIYLLLIGAIIIALAPKRYLYNLAQQTLAKESVVISNELVIDNLLTLNVLEADLYAKDILVGKMEKMTIKPLLLFNQIKIENLKSSKNLEAIFPFLIETAEITQWIGTPFKVSVKLMGSFGVADGFMDLKGRKIYLKISPSTQFVDQIGMFGNEMKKSEGGIYIYEHNY